mmetsp:Transcript_26857/g.53677  ORF Transcript_26857/g.53677 Transcript_26857/m.53677 type:complete len:122 (+) Transcript_26857:2124-2489(+)
MEPRAASCSSVREDSCFGSEWIVFGLDCVWGDVVAESVVFGYRFELKKGVPLTNLNVDNKQEITHHGKDIHIPLHELTNKAYARESTNIPSAPPTPPTPHKKSFLTATSENVKFTKMMTSK